MRIWEMKRAESEEEAEKLLNEGWEPFSADFVLSHNTIITRYMWFKKKITKG